MKEFLGTEDAVSSLTSVRAYRRGVGISDTTFWRWTKLGYFRPINVGGRLYIRREEIRAFEERAERGELARRLPVPGRCTTP